ncbi:methionyl-tRNA formyltransferase [Bacteroides sp. 224]|uniref:methionyl-tRNA formyltransferase n=1 Tax=Bacteroides sp. 224 TaxID=2302936 RepID=UPI0013D6FBD2|nr:methionyl-tRNA formyltransferase [Bacteroides sp. 224]NDV66350.1 methionyl-tRNA formyltransferase [Bacteroides sp. 224]
MDKDLNTQNNQSPSSLSFGEGRGEAIGAVEALRIVYMGTPDFAVEPLRCLVEGGYNVVGVITMPDKPVGRHQSELQASPVKQYAESKNLPLLQPVKLKDEEFLSALRAWKADLQIVVAFRMLPEVVWDMPRLGTFNLHASLLPQYRGAAPINWAVMNGDTETGITTFFLTHEIDTGEVIQQVRVPIADTDNVGVVHDKLMNLGGELVVETVEAILNGTVRSIPQEEMAVVGELRPAPKIFKDTCRIDWSQPTKRIYDFIRGLSPYPAAWTEMETPDGKRIAVKIYETEKINKEHNLPEGSLLTDGKTYLYVATADGMISVKTLQVAGKKRLSIEELLRGFRLADNSRFC